MKEPFVPEKKKLLRVFAPLSGRSTALTEGESPGQGVVPGDGVVIEPTDGLVVAPVSGTLERIFPTNHGFFVRTGGFLILVQVGEGLEPEGRGFTRLKQPGGRVTVGEAVVKVDLEWLRAAGHSALATVTLPGAEGVERLELVEGQVVAGETAVMTAVYAQSPPAVPTRGAQGGSARLPPTQ